jgi:transcription-repair coupling factor (superfamily II helicase)
MEIKYKLVDSIPFLVSEDARNKDNFIFFCEASDVNYFYGLFKFFVKEKSVFSLEMKDDVNFNSSSNIFALSSFQKQINSCNESSALILPVNYLLKISDKNTTTDSLILQKSQKIDITLFNKQMVKLGYKRTDTVRECGDFSNRGEVVDIGFLDYGVRIVLDYDVIDKIRKFDFIEQYAQKEMNEIEVFSCVEEDLFLYLPQKFKTAYVQDSVLKELITNQIMFLKEITQNTDRFEIKTLKRLI